MQKVESGSCASAVFRDNQKQTISTKCSVLAQVGSRRVGSGRSGWSGRVGVLVSIGRFPLEGVLPARLRWTRALGGRHDWMDEALTSR